MLLNQVSVQLQPPQDCTAFRRPQQVPQQVQQQAQQQTTADSAMGSIANSVVGKEYTTKR